MNDLKLNYKKAKFEGKIILVTENEELKKALLNFKDSEYLGFDTETRPSFKKGESYSVSLLQIANEDTAILIRLKNISDFSPLIEIFENSNYLKIGVAIRDDIKQLQKIFSFTPNGFIELANLAKEKKLTKFGLKGMCEEILNFTLSKRAKLSNWDNLILTKEQLSYAATDAWVGQKIYIKLKSF